VKASWRVGYSELLMVPTMANDTLATVFVRKA